MKETTQEDSSGEEERVALEKMKNRLEELRNQNRKLVIEMNNTANQVKALNEKKVEVK